MTSTLNDSSKSINWDTLDAMLIFDHTENRKILGSITIECEGYYQSLLISINTNERPEIQRKIRKIMTFALQFDFPHLLNLTTTFINEPGKMDITNILTELRLLSRFIREKITLTEPLSS